MADDSLISDDLLRKLVGVGQVDLLVGVPTLNHSATITDVITAVEASFRTYFPRQRTVLLHLDGGSTDDTIALAESRRVDPSKTVTALHSLRSTHRISSPYHGHPGRANVPVMLSAADLLQASTVVILDPDVDNITPPWVAALATPVRDAGLDFVAPAFRRQPGEGLLVTQLLRPLVRALYGTRLQEPLVREFGCSGRFAARLTEQLAAGIDLPPEGVNLWLTGSALAEGFNVGQARFGSRHVRPDAPRPALPDLFQSVVATAFTMIDAHGEYCISKTHVEDVLEVDVRVVDGSPADMFSPDAARLLESFSQDVQNLDEILRRILGAETFAAIVMAANATGARDRFPDALWASAVTEFLVAYHHSVMRRDHITQALLPLYVARTGAFLLEHAHSEPEALETALESLGMYFERARVHIVDRWSKPAVR